MGIGVEVSSISEVGVGTTGVVNTVTAVGVAWEVPGENVPAMPFKYITTAKTTMAANREAGLIFFGIIEI